MAKTPKKTPDRHYNFRTMNVWFAWSSLALLAVTLWMVFADYANENRGKPFATTLGELGVNRMPALGFGGCTTLAMAIPLLNFFVVPVAVAGGTLLWQEIHRQAAANERDVS